MKTKRRPVPAPAGGFVDMHCHSTASDGELSPSLVVQRAAEARLTGLILTDHDTVAGCQEAAAAAVKHGIDFLPGVELSCEYPRPGTMHLLGYGVDPNSPTLSRMNEQLQEGRTDRNARIIEQMQVAGLNITMAEVLAEAQGTVGRPHIAKVLLHKGYVGTIKEAFDRYLGQGGKFYQDKERLTATQAIGMVHDAGGVAVLAHPVQLRRENLAQLASVIKDLADVGLDGVEIIHSDHRESLIAELQEMAARYGLLCTGGSDFHGKSKSHIKLGWAGRRRIGREYFDGVVRAVARRRAVVEVGSP